MSKPPPVIIAGQELTREQVARRTAFPDDKLRCGINDIAQRVYELFNVEVTPYYIRRNIATRKLRSRIIHNRVYCSDRDLYDFIILSNPPREMREIESESESSESASA
jgi:hypothetical protein